MTEYIKREELKEMLRREWKKYVPMELDPSLAFILAKVDELPSIYYEASDMYDNDFCSFGERRDD